MGKHRAVPDLQRIRTMITKTVVHTEGKYQVLFNSKVNAWRPYSVVNTVTGKTEFAYDSLAVCLDYISDNNKQR
jgi:hypothetical protein